MVAMLPATWRLFLRRLLPTMIVLGVFISPCASLAQLSQWPTKPVRIVTGWPPGGNVDVISRILAEEIGKRIPQSIVVDNRPGATGTIGARAVVRSEPDGHTWLVATMVESTVVPPMTVQSMQYDPEIELQPVTMIGRWSHVLLINADFPANSVAELVAYAKANPGKLNYGSQGSGSINHFLGEMFKNSAGIEAVHVPYRGSSPMLADLASGQVQFAFDSVGSSLPLIQAGKIKPLAVTSPQRSPALGAVPTTAEAGFPAVASVAWIGVFLPAKTPNEIVNLVHAEVLRTFNGPVLRKALEERAIQPVGNTPEEFRKLIQAETEEKRQLAARLGIKAE
jgi:tripartite-type tricarboxylate transporter receptor subunit TctC